MENWTGTAVNDITYNMIRLALDGDDTLSAADRSAILSACRSPAPASLPTTAEGLRLLPVKQVAAMLSVHPRTVWRLIRSRRLHSAMVAGCRRIRAGDLEALVGRGAGNPQELAEACDSSGSAITPMAGFSKAS